MHTALATPVNASRPRILVAEDHAALRAQIVAVLQAAGWQVDEASDGRLALQLALELPPDVLLLDLGLPGLDGLQVCEQLRRQADRHVPVLMLTAHDTLADKGRGFAADDDEYADARANAALFDALPGPDKRHLRFNGGHVLPADYVDHLLPWLKADTGVPGPGQSG